MSDPQPKKRPIRNWVKKQLERQAGAPSGGPSATSTGLRKPMPKAPKKPQTVSLSKGSYQSPRLSGGGGCPSKGKGGAASCKKLARSGSRKIKKRYL